MDTVSPHADNSNLNPKRCSKCKNPFPATLEYFHSDRNRKEGLFPICKQCCRAYDAQRDTEGQRKEYKRQYRAEHKEESSASYKEYRQSHKEEISTHHKEWAHTHREERLAYNKQYGHTHRKEIVAREREYWRAHREEKNISRRNRHARKRNNGGTHTLQDIRKQYANQKGKCYYCSAKVGKKYHVDHVIPITRGGSNGPENLVITCPHCNVSKSDRLPHEWPKGGRLL